MRFAIYDKTTGQIMRSVTCTQEQVAASCGADELFAPTDVFDDSHYIDVASGAAVAKPARPSPNHIFDYAAKAWVDPRNLAQLRDDKWASVKASMADAVSAALQSDGSLFSPGELVMSPALQLALAGIAGPLGGRINAIHAKGRQLRAQINAASADQLGAITWQ